MALEIVACHCINFYPALSNDRRLMYCLHPGAHSLMNEAIAQSLSICARTVIKRMSVRENEAEV